MISVRRLALLGVIGLSILGNLLSSQQTGEASKGASAKSVTPRQKKAGVDSGLSARKEPASSHQDGGEVRTRANPIAAIGSATNAVPAQNAGAASFHLDVAKCYEDLGLWKEAEDQYIAAGGDASSSAMQRQLAVEGIARGRHARHAEYRSEAFATYLDSTGRAVDAIGKWLLRIVVVMVIVAVGLILILQAPSGSGCVEVAAFSTPDSKKLTTQIESSFLKSRTKLLAANLPSSRSRSQIMVSVDPGVLSDLSFEAGGFKLAGLASVWRLFLRPKFRITGGGHTEDASITVHAEIWRRRWWFGCRLENIVINQLPNPLTIEKLDEFVYAVFLRILYAPR